MTSPGLSAALIQTGLAIVASTGPRCIVAQGDAAAGDPQRGEVLLAAQDDWNAFLVWQGKVGVWTVGSYQVVPQYGCPEVVGLDDAGRCVVIVSYSGKWTPHETIHDGTWLGAMAHLDLDPRAPGLELYAGGRSGTLYQVKQRTTGHGLELDSAEVAHFAADEVNVLVSGDLVPDRTGEELIAFLGSGAVAELRMAADDHAGHPPMSRLAATPLGALPGRIRDAVVLPAPPGHAPWIATVSRAGELALLRMRGDGYDHEVVTREPMGLGRIAAGSASSAAGTVLYATRDDGLILRFERAGAGEWRREGIYAGPQGPRGIAAGRFTADPDAETIAVFGYSKRIEVLSRRAGQPWAVATAFTDAGQGHWLARAELDGRNATDELLACGFGGRILLLARRPGYGLPGIPHDHAPRAVPRIAGNRIPPYTPQPPLSVRLAPLTYRASSDSR